MAGPTHTKQKAATLSPADAGPVTNTAPTPAPDTSFLNLDNANKVPVSAGTSTFGPHVDTMLSTQPVPTATEQKVRERFERFQVGQTTVSMSFKPLLIKP